MKYLTISFILVQVNLGSTILSIKPNFKITQLSRRAFLLQAETPFTSQYKSRKCVFGSVQQHPGGDVREREAARV